MTDLTGLPYASPELLTVARFPLTLGIDAFRDIHITNMDDRYLPGTYRHIDRDFLRWLKIRLESARNAKPPLAADVLAEAERFYADCLRESGLHPSEKSLPSGYGRPTRESAWEFNGTFCIWESTTPPEGIFSMSPAGEKIIAEDSQEVIGKSLPDEMMKCPSLFPLVKGRNLRPRYVRSDQIPHEAEVYHGIGNVWFPIRDHWKLPAGVESKGAVGMWNAESAASPQTGSAAILVEVGGGESDEIENPLDSLI